jgi:hypothetical protein
LDQVGTLVTVFDAFKGSADSGGAGQRIVVFHRKDSPGNKDDTHGSDEWLKQRAALAKTTFSDDPALASYRLLRDVVPNDVEFFFRDTLFDVGPYGKGHSTPEDILTGFIQLASRSANHLSRQRNVLMVRT